ncbi:hypothetical protein EVAR_52754_1 [Eumeta japonica]|uniref:Uncharacterized protein n=1 Tax=Eumeta variegata TaxID=151549 RepID=A0A4C1XBP6_EUMVA|nr:hypothetical protein EVAR_52754_1 [Eumeta japonica]
MSITALEALRHRSRSHLTRRVRIRLPGEQTARRSLPLCLKSVVTLFFVCLALNQLTRPSFAGRRGWYPSRRSPGGSRGESRAVRGVPADKTSPRVRPSAKDGPAITPTKEPAARPPLVSTAFISVPSRRVSQAVPLSRRSRYR